MSIRARKKDDNINRGDWTPLVQSTPQQQHHRSTANNTMSYYTPSSSRRDETQEGSSHPGNNLSGFDYMTVDGPKKNKKDGNLYTPASYFPTSMTAGKAGTPKHIGHSVPYERHERNDGTSYYKVSNLYMLSGVVLVGLLVTFIALALAIVALVNVEGLLGESNCDPGQDLPPRPYDTTVGSWTSAGRDLSGSRYVQGGTISSVSVSSLKFSWSFPVGSAVSGQPALQDGVLYFCDGTSGNVISISASTGGLIWKTAVSSVTGTAGDYCTATVSIDPVNNILVVGSSKTGTVFALSMNTGASIWSTVVETNEYARVTQPPLIYDGIVYVGVSSVEQLAAANFHYPCCSFSGSFVSLLLETGVVQWSTYTVPLGYYGVGIYGGPPTLDLSMRQVYIGTGDLYTDPPGLAACEAAVAALGTTFFTEDPCLPDGVYEDSILALDLATGRPNWGRHVGKADVWNVACGPTSLLKQVESSLNIDSSLASYNCPTYNTQNSDFGLAPMIVELGGYKDVLLIGQKSGILWTLDNENGNIMNSVSLCPWGYSGGILYEPSNDGNYAFLPLTNSAMTNFSLPHNAAPSNASYTVGSAFAAVHAASSSVAWTFGLESWLYAALPTSATNDVVFIPAVSRTSPPNPASSIRALSATTGKVLWTDTTTGLAPTSGVTIGSGQIFLGTSITDPVTLNAQYSVSAYAL